MAVIYAPVPAELDELELEGLDVEELELDELDDELELEAVTGLKHAWHFSPTALST